MSVDIKDAFITGTLFGIWMQCVFIKWHLHAIVDALKGKR